MLACRRSEATVSTCALDLVGVQVVQRQVGGQRRLAVATRQTHETLTRTRPTGRIQATAQLALPRPQHERPTSTLALRHRQELPREPVHPTVVTLGQPRQVQRLRARRHLRPRPQSHTHAVCIGNAAPSRCCRAQCLGLVMWHGNQDADGQHGHSRIPTRTCPIICKPPSGDGS